MNYIKRDLEDKIITLSKENAPSTEDQAVCQSRLLSYQNTPTKIGRRFLDKGHINFKLTYILILFLFYIKSRVRE